MPHTPRPGAPDWADADTLAAGPALVADDATLVPETWHGGARLRITGVREDDASWSSDTAERLFSDADVGAMCRTLGTGQDAVREESAWGRVYRSTWSLDPPTDAFGDTVFVWFYPMTEARMTLRIRRDALACAMLQALDWWDTQPLPAANRRELAHARTSLSMYRPK